VTSVLLLMAVQGGLGAFDTAYYHEYRARLVAGGARTRAELWLHALRDCVYAVLFATLPLVAWCGAWARLLVALIALEIVVTMADFAIEVRTRGPEGVAAGERITHGLMAIVYGAMLAQLAPHVLAWWGRASAFTPHAEPVSGGLRGLLLAMAFGVFASGMRDAYAALGGRHAAFPWPSTRE
jgi:hypothetical protein